MVTGTFTGKQMQRFPMYADHNLGGDQRLAPKQNALGVLGGEG